MAPSAFQPHIHVTDTDHAAADECAAFILESLKKAVSVHAKATIALSGGSTPKLLFATLTKAQFDWAPVHFFFTDERCVPPNDPESNFKLADEALFTPLHISKYNVHRVHGEMPPAEAAERYIEEIRDFFALKPGALPEFDIVHRGMGPDGHTASLFPGSPLIANHSDLAASVWGEKKPHERVTLLPGVLQSARQTVILAAGADKSEALWNTLYGPEDPSRFPCQIGARGSDRAVWFVDKAAAAKL